MRCGGVELGPQSPFLKDFSELRSQRRGENHTVETVDRVDRQ
jgi:hypothetical protein